MKNKILVFAIIASFIFSGVTIAAPLDGEWKTYLDILVFSSPTDAGIKLRNGLERHFTNIASFDSFVSVSSLRQPLQYNGYHVIFLLGGTKAGPSLDIPDDVEAMIEDRCKTGVSGLIVSGDIIHPDSNNPLIQKLVGAQLMEEVTVSRQTIRVLDITDCAVTDVAQSFDLQLGTIRKVAKHPGTKTIAVTNSGVDFLTVKPVVTSKASYIALGTNCQALDNIEVTRLLSNQAYCVMGTGWLQALEAPSNVRAIPGDGKARILWDAPKKVDEMMVGYDVIRTDESGKSLRVHDFTLDKDVFQFDDDNLINGKLYKYKVCSVTSHNKPIACSKEVSVRPGAMSVEVPPWPPVGQVSQTIGTKHKVKGKAPPGSKVRIEYKYIPSGETGFVEVVADKNGDFETEIPLKPGQKVEYYIIVKNELGDEVKIGPFIIDPIAQKIILSMTIGSTKAYVNGLEWPEAITAPFITPKTNRTMVPFRFIGERLGAEIDYYPKDKQVEWVSYKLQNNFIKIWIGKNEATYNNATVTLDQPPQIVKGRTMVPVRFVSEQLGAKVDWIQAAKMVVVTYPNPGP